MVQGLEGAVYNLTSAVGALQPHAQVKPQVVAQLDSRVAGLDILTSQLSGAVSNTVPYLQIFVIVSNAFLSNAGPSNA